MAKNNFSSVILWMSVLFGLPVHSNLQEFTNIQNDDPDVHVEGLTYGRLTFLRGCLVKMQNLNSDGSCNENFSASNHPRYHHHSHDPSIYQPLQCGGNVFECVAVKHFATVVTARIDNQYYRFSVNEKYNNVDVKQFNNESIELINQELTRNTDSSEMCKCYCDDESERETVRSFCQDIVETDSVRGYVLTGIRFKIIRRIVYLEVQQGKLVNGNIDLNTVHWKNSQSCKYYGKLNYDHRALQLDDVFVPENHAVTGVMWIRYHQRTAYHGFERGRLMLGIKATKVNIYGNLIPEKWLIREKISTRRRLLHIFSQHILSSPKNRSQELSIPNKYYIKFRTTGWEKDFAQHVVPFIDLQEVVSNSSKPIIGILSIGFRMFRIGEEMETILLGFIPLQKIQKESRTDQIGFMFNLRSLTAEEFKKSESYG